MSFCANCGNEVEEKVHYCRNCGSLQKSDEPFHQNDKKSLPEKRRFSHSLLLIISFLVIGIGMAIYMLFSDDKFIFDNTLFRSQKETIVEEQRPALQEETEMPFQPAESAIEEADSTYYIDYEDGSIPISEVPIGSKIIDFSWEWEFRGGYNYTNLAGDFAKPVVWLVVAKDHYEAIDSHVTLLSEDIIGFYPFDNSPKNSIKKYGYNRGINHWGKSGAAGATHSLRAWLNSIDIHEGEGFFQAFSESFKSSIITTILPNSDWEKGHAYSTEDKVFIPSTTELGDSEHNYTYKIGDVYPYYSGAADEVRISYFRNSPRFYRTRSPISGDDERLFIVEFDGSFFSSYGPAHFPNIGVRPVLNLNSDTLVSEFRPEVDQDIVIVNANYLRLRSGPGTEYSILDRLMKGNKLKLVSIENKWLHVATADGIKGWVHGDYTDSLSDIETSLTYPPDGIVYPQPVGYLEEDIANFVEKATSFKFIDFVIPEFENPNDISNEDLIKTITLNRIRPEHHHDIDAGRFILGEDVQMTARLIFGPDIKDIKHDSIFPYLWSNDDQAYKVVGFGPGSYTKTTVINVKEKEQEFVVDVVHLIYYYNPQAEIHESYVAGELSRMSDFDNYDDFYENAIHLVDEQHHDNTIEQHLNLFPIRRYILSKEGDGILYIRQSYIVIEN